jgi:hypothetical protein
MAAQFGVRALVKRFLVQHASKLVSLACFGAAMQVREVKRLIGTWLADLLWHGAGLLACFGAAMPVVKSLSVLQRECF